MVLSAWPMPDFIAAICEFKKMQLLYNKIDTLKSMLYAYYKIYPSGL